MKYFRSHENADLTFKYHSIKRKSKPVLRIQLSNGVPSVGYSTDSELSPPFLHHTGLLRAKRVVSLLGLCVTPITLSQRRPLCGGEPAEQAPRPLWSR